MYGKKKRKSGKKITGDNGKGRTKRIVLYCAAGTLAVLLLLYLGISFYFSSHLFFNTSLDGYDCSGKTASQAEEILQKRAAEYELKIISKDGKSYVIPGQDIDVSMKNNEASIEKVIGEQNAFAWIAALFEKHNQEISLEISYNAEKADSIISAQDILNEEGTESVSAYPKYDGTQFVVEPEVYGTKVDGEMLKEKMDKAVKSLNPSLDLEKEECYSTPKYTSESEEVKAACDLMNQYCKTSITYTMGEDVVLDKNTISGWLHTDENMNVSIDENAVKSWLEEFGNKYDTVGVTRNFTTPTGKSATVSGGTYGWSIDEDTEFTAILDAVKKGETLSKEPAYYIGGEAASHTMPDWGTTFAEVDLSQQHMWYVKDGAVQLETDVVTGEPIPSMITPEGVYSILEKSLDEVLVGETNPATGQPIYRTPVDYWMRVTWTGIGFHDANWQSAFGGTLNQIHGIGSHGCINMPVDKAAALYDMIEIGTPVVIHY